MGNKWTSLLQRKVILSDRRRMRRSGPEASELWRVKVHDWKSFCEAMNVTKPKGRSRLGFPLQTRGTPFSSINTQTDLYNRNFSPTLLFQLKSGTECLLETLTEICQNHKIISRFWSEVCNVRGLRQEVPRRARSRNWSGFDSHLLWENETFLEFLHYFFQFTIKVSIFYKLQINVFEFLPSKFQTNLTDLRLFVKRTELWLNPDLKRSGSPDTKTYGFTSASQTFLLKKDSWSQTVRKTRV